MTHQVLAFYNPETGRWLNRDPIAEKGEKNLYGFVANDALGKYDILGMVLNVRYYTWDSPKAHAWISTLIGSYGWYPTINWDDQTFSQRLGGVPGVMLSPDPHEFRIPPLQDDDRIVNRVEIETKQKKSGMLEHGPGWGRKCKCLNPNSASDRVIVQLCVDEAARAQTGKWHALWGNCRDRAKGWLTKCCMQLGRRESSQEPPKEDHTKHPGGTSK